MKKIAIIPLRAGSKGIPGKNKKKLLGKPLFSWILGEAIFSDLDKIYIFTDDKDIAYMVKENYFWTNKVEIMIRSKESATDTASTEIGMKELAEKLNYNFDILCLLQATSPLTSKEDINNCLYKIIKEKYDSAVTVVNTMRFLWNKNGKSINYDFQNRPRRQEFSGILVENGAVYVTTKQQFLESGIRIGGNVAVVKMHEDTLTEIDEIEDWIIMEKLLENRLMKRKKGSNKIRLLVLDVDGIFTDAKVTVNNTGEFSKEFSLIDGMGIELLREEGIEIIVMTSEKSEIVIKRNEIAYLGDDINDLANICSVKWGIVPQNAVLENKLKADFVLNSYGGNGAIREIVNFLIKYNRNI